MWYAGTMLSLQGTLVRSSIVLLLFLLLAGNINSEPMLFSYQNTDPDLEAKITSKLADLDYDCIVYLGLYDLENLSADHQVRIKKTKFRYSYFIQGHGISGRKRSYKDPKAIVQKLLQANQTFNLTSELHIQAQQPKVASDSEGS